MKKGPETAVVDLNEFEILYSLLQSDTGRFGIACRCSKSGKVLSDYVNPNLFSVRAAAEHTFRVLVDNAVFPIHIPDILADLVEESDQRVMAIA